LTKGNSVIRFENVDFSYHDRNANAILRNISFDLQRGKRIAICGSSGSGYGAFFYKIIDGTLIGNPPYCAWLSDSTIHNLVAFSLEASP
jgi:ABC-type transport system involved in cytochrome bd biosynthesis fused ATPase/permease subunit